MERGQVFERASASINPAERAQDFPARRLWARQGEQRATLEITVFCCPTCGLLQQFAR
jgi:hypothetical protein